MKITVDIQAKMDKIEAFAKNSFVKMITEKLDEIEKSTKKPADLQKNADYIQLKQFSEKIESLKIQELSITEIAEKLGNSDFMPFSIVKILFSPEILEFSTGLAEITPYLVDGKKAELKRKNEKIDVEVNDFLHGVKYEIDKEKPVRSNFNAYLKTLNETDYTEIIGQLLFKMAIIGRVSRSTGEGGTTIKEFSTDLLKKIKSSDFRGNKKLTAELLNSAIEKPVDLVKLQSNFDKNRETGSTASFYANVRRFITDYQKLMKIEISGLKIKNQVISAGTIQVSYPFSK